MAQKLEVGYLLRCVSGQVREAGLNEFDSLSDSDWKNIIRVSLRHNVIPQVYENLKTEIQKVAIPEWVLQELRELYHQHALLAVQQFDEISRILHEFSNTSLQVIVLKGAHLAEIIYDHHSFRPMTDLDLFVKKENLEDAEVHLLSLGYNSSRPYDLQKELENHHHLPPFVKENALPVEIHWSLLLALQQFAV
jgi:hypothetical protein